MVMDVSKRTYITCQIQYLENYIFTINVKKTLSLKNKYARPFVFDGVEAVYIPEIFFISIHLPSVCIFLDEIKNYSVQ